ncbi:hypothetical protein BC829DRAFT_210755 [Chytridium lagenaria]|nr:hypothetical protein BC829DRAFT_210755 [Chytridium lagenaria]
MGNSKKKKKQRKNHAFKTYAAKTPQITNPRIDVTPQDNLTPAFFFFEASAVSPPITSFCTPPPAQVCGAPFAAAVELAYILAATALQISSTFKGSATVKYSSAGAGTHSNGMPVMDQRRRSTPRMRGTLIWDEGVLEEGRGGRRGLLRRGRMGYGGVGRGCLGGVWGWSGTLIEWEEGVDEFGVGEDEIGDFLFGCGGVGVGWEGVFGGFMVIFFGGLVLFVVLGVDFGVAFFLVVLLIIFMVVLLYIVLVVLLLYIVLVVLLLLLIILMVLLLLLILLLILLLLLLLLLLLPLLLPLKQLNLHGGA